MPAIAIVTKSPRLIVRCKIIPTYKIRVSRLDNIVVHLKLIFRIFIMSYFGIKLNPSVTGINFPKQIKA